MYYMLFVFRDIFTYLYIGAMHVTFVPRKKAVFFVVETFQYII